MCEYKVSCVHEPAAYMYWGSSGVNLTHGLKHAFQPQMHACLMRTSMSLVSVLIGG